MANVEIYNRMPSDINYVPILEHDNELEQILTRCKMYLGTTPGQVLGDPDFGIDLKQYIFAYGIDANRIQNQINIALNKYCNINPQRYVITCQLNYGHDHYNRNDYCIIDILINDQKYMGVLATS